MNQNHACFRAIGCESTLAYLSDVSSCRCRLSSSAFAKLRVRCGWIIRLCFRPNSVLCTVWPDSKRVLSDDEIIFDGSLFEVSDAFAGTCWVEVVGPPKSVSNAHIALSVSTATSSLEQDIASSHLLGWPLCVGYQFRIPFSQARADKIRVLSCSPAAHGIVGQSTILISSTGKQASVTDTGISTSDSGAKVASVTSSLEEIVYRFLVPSLILPNASLLIRGILMGGPPGVGKTFAVKHLPSLCAELCEVGIFELNVPHALSLADPSQYVANIFENQIRFHSMQSQFNLPKLSVVVLDEVDALGSISTESTQQAVVKVLINSYFDQLSTTSFSPTMRSAVVGTCNSLDAVCPTLRLGGRFEVEIEVSTTAADRALLIEKATRSVCTQLLADRQRISTESACDTDMLEKVFEDLKSKLVERTGGYSAADINRLFAVLHKELHSLNELSTQSEASTAINSAFKASLAATTASCLRGVTVRVPTVSFGDVIGNESVKTALRRMLSTSQLAQRKYLERYDVTMPRALLLFGPAGNSKTRLAMAAANEFHLPLISLSCADVYSPYVGDAEAVIRRAFRLAIQAKPCILLLDEIDALVSNRFGSGSNSSSSSESRVLATLLTEIDGIDSKQSLDTVYLIAATNRLEAIDDALLRKGRFHHILEVPNPNEEDMLKILKYYSAKHQLSPVAAEAVRKKLRIQRNSLLQPVSGAVIENCCREEAFLELRQCVQEMMRNKLQT